MAVKAKKEESLVLFLPKDGGRVTQLERKIRECKEGISNYPRLHPNQHPEFREAMLVAVVAEKEILESLLGDGIVNGWAHSKAFIEEHAGGDKKKLALYARAWCNAWEVVSDNCESGGTGLK